MHRLRLPSASFLALAASAALVGCNDSSGSGTTTSPPSTAPTSLLLTLERNGLTTLKSAIEAAGLEALLAGPGPLTLFGPTNAAFGALPPGELMRLLEPGNVAELEALLRYHLVDAQLPAATLEGLQSQMTNQGDDLLLDLPGGVLFVNQARVTGRDVAATNGVLHIVNSVLVPPAPILDTLEARRFTILLELIDLAGLGGALTGGNVTLLAPTDDAFNALPAGRLDELRNPAYQDELRDLLQFHLVPGVRAANSLLEEGDTPNLQDDLLFCCVHGNQLRFNEVAAPRFNVPATDGLVHVLDGVLDPTERLRAVLDAQGLTVLAGLVDLAGLTPTLEGPGAWTIFAPTDAAFAALPAGELLALQDPANVALREAFLMRHLVSDALQLVELARRDALMMASGTIYPIMEGATTVSIGGIEIGTGDVLASNGILHQLESVLP